MIVAIESFEKLVLQVVNSLEDTRAASIHDESVDFKSLHAIDIFQELVSRGVFFPLLMVYSLLLLQTKPQDPGATTSSMILERLQDPGEITQ